MEDNIVMLLSALTGGIVAGLIVGWAALGKLVKRTENKIDDQVMVIMDKFIEELKDAEGDS